MKTFYVHDLVARHFIEKPDDGKIYTINHIDRNTLNNNVSNLEWATISE